MAQNDALARYMTNRLSTSGSDALNRYLGNLANDAPSAPSGDSGAGAGSGGGASGSGGGSGDSKTFTHTPDYQNLILNDPAYLLGKGNVDVGDLQAANLRQQLVRQALIHYGKIPSFNDPNLASLIASDVDPTTRDLAAENQNAGTSTLGELGYAHGQSLANLRALLASRGILNSGQDALMEGDEGKKYAGALDTAQQDLFNTLYKGQQDYLAQFNTGQQTLANLASSVADRLQNSNAFDPSNVTATADHTVNGPGGSTPYKDPNGNYWDGNGNPLPGTSVTPKPTVVGGGNEVNVTGSGTAVNPDGSMSTVTGASPPVVPGAGLGAAPSADKTPDALARYLNNLAPRPTVLADRSAPAPVLGGSVVAPPVASGPPPTLAAPAPIDALARYLSNVVATPTPVRPIVQSTPAPVVPRAAVGGAVAF